MSFVVIIPARFSSSRLPGKPLANINGKPMVVHVMERALASGAARVIVATDHKDIAREVAAVGGEVCMTRSDHKSGTERLVEVIEYYRFNDDTIIVNVQGDEPMIPPITILQVAENLANKDIEVATLAVPINSMEEVFNPNVVKVVRDVYGHALYFSRAAIPWNREHVPVLSKVVEEHFLRHIGIYSYRARFIRRYVSWKASKLEQIELLEQLRILWYGEKVHVDVAKAIPSVGVDTQEDLFRVRTIMQ